MMIVTDRKKRALRFVVLVGVMSLFADFTYEGARGIAGPFLGALGASGAVVGIASGLGEFLGYALRIVSGRLERAGTPIGPFDTLIAAQAVGRKLILVSNWCRTPSTRTRAAWSLRGGGCAAVPRSPFATTARASCRVSAARMRSGTSPRTSGARGSQVGGVTGEAGGVGLVSQRPGKLDQDVLSQCMTQIMLRIVNPIDQNNVAAAVEGASRDVLDELPAEIGAPSTFTEIVVTELHETGSRALSGRRLAEYLAAELRGPILASGVEMEVHDAMAKGTAQKSGRRRGA